MKNLTRVDVRQGPSDEELIGRIRGEYLEMPGLRLTRPQYSVRIGVWKSVICDL